MECLSPEQLAAYVRGGGADPRGVEAHVRDCPACGMELLLAREVLAELRPKALRPATDRFRPATPRNPSASWIPWAAAAAVLAAALVYAVSSPKNVPPPVAVKPPDIVKPMPPSPEVPVPPRPEAPKPLPPAPEPLKPVPKPDPLPVKAPEPEPVKPPPPPVPPAPEPEPKKPAPTLVEKAVVARVMHSTGGPASNAGRVFRAGEALVTARQEFLDVAVEGYGRLYLRENSQAEIGAAGEVTLNDGELLARADAGKKWGAFKTPLAPIEAAAPLLHVQTTKTSTEVSILSGRVMMASATASGPSTLILKAGKAPELRPLDPGFASWVPDKLASRRFTGWFEAEEFPAMQGFKALPAEQASGRQAAVQVADQGAIAYKGSLPFKGRHYVWLRVRQYEAKAAMIGLHLNGQSAGELKLEFSEGKAWRWVGPLVVNADRLDLAVTALSRWPQKEGADAKSFPVVVDLMLVTTDAKQLPPEKPGDETRGLDLLLDAPLK